MSPVKSYDKRIPYSFVLAIEIEIYCKKNNQTRPDVIGSERFGKEEKGKSNGKRLTKGGYRNRNQRAADL